MMSIDSHPPAFLENPSDNFLDDTIDSLSTLAFGAYNRLKQRAWTQRPIATIPTDDQVLARWARLTMEQWQECRTAVLACFKPYGDDRYIEPRLSKAYQKYLIDRKKKSAAGKKGADARWPKNGSAMAEPCERQGDAMATTSQSHAIKPNNPKTLNNPVTQNKQTDKTQGGFRGERFNSVDTGTTQVFTQYHPLGSLLDSLPGDAEIPCDSFDSTQVFKLFRDLFVDNGVTGAIDLDHKARKCKVTPARWTMLYLDKIHYVYGAQENTPFYDQRNAHSDPVALTISGIRRNQSPTDSARNLFKEIVIEKVKLSGKSPRFNNLTGELIATELAKRKSRRHE